MPRTQIGFLKNNNLEEDLRRDILDFLSANKNNYYTSHEIANTMNSKAYTEVKRLLVNYKKSGFSEPASHIGAVSAELVEEGLLRRDEKMCLYAKVTKPSFSAKLF